MQIVLMFAFSLKKNILDFKSKLNNINWILSIIVIMSNLATSTTIFTVKLMSVTIVALNLYACLANVRKIKSGLHLGLSAV